MLTRLDLCFLSPQSEIELKNAEKKVLDAVKVAASQSLDAQTRALESLNHSMEQRHRDVQLPSEMAIPPHVSPADLPPDDPQLRVFEALQAQFESRVASPTGLVARVMRQKLEDARRSGGTVGPATLGADVSNALNELEHASQRALDSADAIEREYNLRPAAAKQETK